MLKSHRPEFERIQNSARKLSLASLCESRRALFYAARLLAVILVLLLAGAPLQAQVAGPQRAIEKLEGCSSEERKQGCISILSRRAEGGSKQAIKAQVRGGRIIWYEYDSKSGRVRRTN